MKTRLHHFTIVLVIFFTFLFSAVGFGQTIPLEYYIQSYTLESGYYNGTGNPVSNSVVVFSDVVEMHNIPWLQLHFSNANLGNESYIVVKSLQDNLWQKLDAVSIKQWNYYSAFFNGNAVEISLFVAPFDEQVFVNIDEVIAGEWLQGNPSFSICGPTDDRTPSNQPATARLLSVGCTAWIIPNGKFVSAGHCLDGSSATVVEFNVPPSLPNGTIQHPGPQDQYSVDVTTKIFVNGGVGNDWGVFEVFPNSITGLKPKQAQNAYWPLVQDLGPVSIRITGYGVDDGAANQTQQTHVGPNAGSSGTTMRYVTDTQGGNSGSPVIDALTNNAVGIHTHGGCTSSGGNNNGTSTFLAAFWDAVDEGIGDVVDPTNVMATPISGSQIGVTFSPNSNNNNVVVVWNNTGTFTIPTGTPPVLGQPFAGGTLLYNGTTSPVNHTGLNPLTTYYYKAFSYNGTNYSPGVAVNATTLDFGQAAVDFALHVTDNAGLSSIINFGLDLTATDGTDLALGEAELPGLPPGGYFAAWLFPDFTTLSYKDYRAPGNPPAFPFTGHKSHIIRIQTDIPAGNPMTISWNLPSTIAATSTISAGSQVVSFSGIGIITFNYNPAPGPPNLQYVFVEVDYIDPIQTFELTVLAQNGWNMVSAPGLHPTDQNVGTWWPHKTGTVWGFNGVQYVARLVTTPGEGYWMRNTVAETYNYPAIQIVPHNPIPVTLGWNMIGGYETSPSVANLKLANPQITGTVWGFNGVQYVAASNIVPGYSYWVKVTSAGNITIPDVLAKGNEVVELFKEDLPTGQAGWGRIILTDAAGISSTLYAVKGEVDLNHYELPPLPPEGSFDIRFSSGRIAEDINSAIQTIDMSGVTYPLTVRVEGMDIRLMDKTGKLVKVDLKAGEDVLIADATITKLMVFTQLIPEKYALELNYPNPFNPSTVIEFSLPEDVSNVKLSIYNALGEKVAELVNTALVAGKYSYQWNAQNVATGIYVYELRTDKFVAVKKMILLK